MVAGDIAEVPPGEAALAVALDVTDSRSVDEAVSPAPNASSARSRSSSTPPAGTSSTRSWRPRRSSGTAIIELNYKGCLRVCRRVVPGMVEREYGRVVNISSDAARVGSSLEAVYAGAKAAQVAFGKTLAREVARRGVTVNSVCPGPTETPLLEGMMGAGEGARR